ncbi:MAG TPA: SagB/ThcOx family dehydrogenase [Desulfurococcales archaeon]|nr:SagB/ThcOx family dehydrogenase [Desulfurococcales archaeon]
MQRRLIVLSLMLTAIAVAAIIIVPYIPRGNIEKEVAKLELEVKKRIVFLPLPRIKGNMSVEEALAYRRSIRDYTDEPLTLTQLSQILWAAQGISETRWGLRTCPSAGATYPLEVYVVVGSGGVKGLTAGIYHYDPYTHTLILIKEGDYREELYKAGLNQPWILNAPVNLVITAEYERTTRRYGERGIRYVHMEVGHAGQNVYLQATALGLGAVVIGAFYDDWVREIIGAPKNQHPLYIIPIGVPKREYRISESELWEYIQRNREKLS